ncbi:MAG TPA: insulinase family protein, partial [Cytophagaceae bacterium]
MKSTYFLFIISFLFILQPYLSSAQKYVGKVENGQKYNYTAVTNDPINAREYTLKNGLKVFLSVYKDAPRIQTYIAVKAGSKNDPSHATGLAHYLEHILFKGTSEIGTQNWEKEKPEIDKIEALYEVYRKTRNESERTKL